MRSNLLSLPRTLGVCVVTLFLRPLSHMFVVRVGWGVPWIRFVDAMANGHRFSRSTPAQVPDGGGQEGRLVLRSPVAADLQSGHCTVSSCLFASALWCRDMRWYPWLLCLIAVLNKFLIPPFFLVLGGELH